MPPERALPAEESRVAGPWSPYLIEPRAPTPIVDEAEHARLLLAQAAVRFVVASGRIDTAAQREMGRDLGRRAGRGDISIHAALDALPGVGVGHLSHEEPTPGRHVFRSRDLTLARAGKAPSCTLVLGFAEGLVTGMTDEPALGTEVSCRSTGAAECVFVVSARLHHA
jgi:predicted hydrocarbon binding protein